MTDNPNIPVHEENPKHLRASEVPADNYSPRSGAEPKPCCHGMNSRNLIVCIDGTSNQFGEKNTNVIELYNLILKADGDNQRTWYNSGIGTYARPSWKTLRYYKKVLSHKMDLAIAWNFERTVLGACHWLSDNYEDGDCIFLFGFSRGAFQVRVLSAMIDKVGLIYKGNEMQIPFAYELYADPKTDEPTATKVGSEDPMSMAECFKNAFSHKDVKVHFVGAWDTVSSIGVVRGKRMLPRTIDGMKHVCYFRHALALDERRVKFLPEYAYGGKAMPPAKLEDKKGSAVKSGSHLKANNPPPEDDNVGDRSLGNKMSMRARTHTMEVWFAGTHSDIGGGNSENIGMDRSRPPLRWMVFEAGALGLRMARFKRQLSPTEQIDIKESLTGIWWLFEFVPFKRLTFTRQENGKHTTHKPHLGSSRKIHLGQKIHSSLLLTDKTKAQYTPKARPLNDDISFWEELLKRQGSGQWLEVDLYEDTQALVMNFIFGHSIALQTLRQIATWSDGRQAVYEEVIKALKNESLGSEGKLRLLHATMDILSMGSQGNRRLELHRSLEIHPLVSDLWHSSREDYQEVAREFMVRFTNPCQFVLEGHTSTVTSVAFSPDGKRIISGSRDDTIRIWDAETGAVVAVPLEGHTRSVTSVAFSPDGRRIISGSEDCTIRIWDAETGEAVAVPLEGHTGYVHSVAFSPDGMRIISGSDDKTIRIWDRAKTGAAVGVLHGHTGPVTCIAFSPDGKYIVSASSDTAIGIWDARAGTVVGVHRGHSRSVTSVAFSPDSRRIISGSDDKTIRIWDAKTGPAMSVLHGHTSPVMSVAYSPDGKYIVSASWDNTIRIWDAETGQATAWPLTGHADSVNSVAFSPDGNDIISGSDDKTIRIWNVETASQQMCRSGTTYMHHI